MRLTGLGVLTVTRIRALRPADMEVVWSRHIRERCSGTASWRDAKMRDQLLSELSLMRRVLGGRPRGLAEVSGDECTRRTREPQ
jgi:hypothetical protein